MLYIGQSNFDNMCIRFVLTIATDDSGSMQFEENGERIKDLQLIIQRVAFAATLFDDDGIEVRFMNDDPPPQMTSHIKTEQQVEALLAQKRYKGLTPMGTKLREKVIDGIVLSNLRSGQMRKPVLVIAVTDGQPAGEPQNAVFDTVKYAVDQVSRSQYGPGAVAFQFAQVGNDEKAREFLGKLDNDPSVGQMVDCTSNYENESMEMARANPPVDLTPDLWVSNTSAHMSTVFGSTLTSQTDAQAHPRRDRPLLRHKGREAEPWTRRPSRLRWTTTTRSIRRPTTWTIRWPTTWTIWGSSIGSVRCSTTWPGRLWPAPAGSVRPTGWLQ